MASVVPRGFLSSAFRHGETKQSIGHALRNPIRVADLDDGVTLCVGPDYSGRLIEVLVNRQGKVFHAMKARSKFFHEVGDVHE